MGIPLTPPGGLPGGPVAADPITPYNLDKYAPVTDPTDWQLWWEFNKDLYLRYSGINTGIASTGSDDFFLGRGQRDRQQVGGRASDELIDGEVVRALLDGLQKGGSNAFAQSGLIAMTKVGGERNRARFDFVTEWFLSNGTEPMHPTAAFALGLTGDSKKIDLLRSLALDTESGRKAVGADTVTGQVSTDVRAFAAYGLGMIGARSTDRGLRSQIVRDLIDLLEAPSLATNDVQVAAMVAIGLVPLHVDEDVVACYCGTCTVPDPETSLRPQVTYLLRYFTADKEFDPILRSHTATTLGRLVAARPDGMTERMKEGVAEVLVRSLESSSKQPSIVKESAVLALGLIGDADDGDIDQWIRWSLRRSLRSKGELERRFAHIALAQTGGREGQGEEPWAGLPSIRKTLVGQLSRAKKREKPWAALALGVLGHDLRQNGVDLDSGVDLALRSTLRGAKKLSDVGALSLALGLRHDAEATEMLLAKLDKVKDEGARGYAAIGLGLIGAREAVEPLQHTLRHAEKQPLLQIRAGLALGMLGDSSVVTELLETFDASEHEAAKGAAMTALGFIGDRRAVDKLVEVVLDEKDAYEDDTRERAMIALGFVGDRSHAPWRTSLTLGTNYRAETPTLTSGKGTGVLNLN